MGANIDDLLLPDFLQIPEGNANGAIRIVYGQILLVHVRVARRQTGLAESVHAFVISVYYE